VHFFCIFVVPTVSTVSTALHDHMAMIMISSILSPFIMVELPIRLNDTPHEALMSVWWTSIMLKKISTKIFQPELASEAQFNVLMLLKDTHKPMTQNDLSRKLLVDKSNITGLLDRLEKQGLLVRSAVEGDRRSYHVELTKEGRRVVNKLDKRYTGAVEAVMNELTSEEHDVLIRLTKKVRTGLMKQLDEVEAEGVK
jgi:DNA-binding MarR family transcriptional regulator